MHAELTAQSVLKKKSVKAVQTYSTSQRACSTIGQITVFTPITRKVIQTITFKGGKSQSHAGTIVFTGIRFTLVQLYFTHFSSKSSIADTCEVREYPRNTSTIARTLHPITGVNRCLTKCTIKTFSAVAPTTIIQRSSRVQTL